MTVPQHVAIIPDGNRRWARAQGLAGTKGHAAAIREERITSFLHEAKALGVRYVSLWGFSTENWKRSKKEVDALFRLLRDACAQLREDAEEEGVRFRWLGRRDRVPTDVREELESLEAETAAHEKIHFSLCFDYGGRDEILRAVNRAVRAGKELDESSFGALLDTSGIPDPDLIVRTSGEQRLSGLFAWQGAYAELLFVEQHFPDFGPADFRAAVEEFSRRKRRFGGD